ncbi:hypothetical protein D3C72_902930 [compost metagenome]
MQVPNGRITVGGRLSQSVRGRGHAGGSVSGVRGKVEALDRRHLDNGVLAQGVADRRGVELLVGRWGDGRRGRIIIGPGTKTIGERGVFLVHVASQGDVLTGGQGRPPNA